MSKTILVDAINTFVIKEEGIFEDMHKILEEFKNKKIILTNANDEEKVKYGVTNMPYEIFTLEHDPEKAAPEYYKKMLEHFSLTPEDVICFEHKEDAVKSARSIGINTFHYNKETKNLVALKDFLKNNL